MSTSGSVNYTASAAVIITEAYRKIGDIEEGTTASTAQLNDAAPAFNMMIKAFHGYGMPLWSIKTSTIDLGLNDGSYGLGTGSDIQEKALRVTNVVLRDTDSNDTELFPLSRQEYWALSNKTSSGTPTQWYYDPQISSGNLYVWPVPDATSAGYTLYVTYQRPLEDIDTVASDDVDFPSEWHEALSYALAVRLAPSSGLPVKEREFLRIEAKDAIDLALSFDVETGSVFLMPSDR